jgi:flavin-dependent dehydrogenase
VYDAIVIGARCAGAPLAMLLARAGARVLLVDRAAFPSDIPHGHFIHRHGPKRLRDWGLLSAIADRTPPVTSMLVDLGDFPLRAEHLVEDGVAWGYGPRRITLDQILIDAAVASGAEFRPRFSVGEYLFEDSRVIGIRGRDANGGPIEERAPLTIGADGRHSPLARAVQAPMYEETPPILCYYFSYWSGVRAGPFELYARAAERRVLFSFRTEHDLYAVFVGLPIEELAAARRDIEGTVWRALELAPDFASRVGAGRREERFYGATDLPNFYRKPYGPGWALVGDAGAHKDPYMALGICDALRDAEYLAEAVRDGLGGGRPLESALADYESRRNAASAADYTANLAEARFTPPRPDVLALRAAIKDKPEEVTRLMKAREGMIDPATFFSPENMQRLLGARAGS